MKTNLTITVANDEYGKDLILDFIKNKHLLIGGSTGSGKSVLIHKIISDLIAINLPHDLRFILIDPKRIELGVYDGLPNLLTPVIFETKKAILALKWVTKEIDRRLGIFKENKIRDISEYEGEDSLPVIVVIVDEISDIMIAYPKETEPVILKIAQMGHITGVHMVLATSRPNSKVFTKDIRNSISSRIALQVATAQDSKLLIDIPDAVNLRGKGDMIFREGLKYPIHAQVFGVDYKEVEKRVKKYSQGYVLADDGIVSDYFFQSENDWIHGKDELYEQAKGIVIESGKASTSWLQRKLGIGYSRAAMLIDQLEEKGVVGPARGSEPRKVIIK